MPSLMVFNSPWRTLVNPQDQLVRLRPEIAPLPVMPRFRIVPCVEFPVRSAPVQSEAARQMFLHPCASLSALFHPSHAANGFCWLP